MSTPTPRTQALWMKHHAFCNEEEATEALCDFRDLGNALETELASALARIEEEICYHARTNNELTAAKAERDLNITRVASIIWSGALDKFTGGGVQTWVADYNAELAALRAEMATCKDASEALVESLRAENERLKGMRTRAEAIMTTVAEESEERAIARAERAEAALALKNAQCDRAERAAAGALADFGEKVSPTLTGKVTHAGWCNIGEDHIDGVFVQIPREQLKAAPSLPMYRTVAITVLPEEERKP